MADTDRMSLLPTIKCSNCAVDIEILQLADHVCATSSNDAGPLPPTLDRASTFGGASFNKRSEGQQRYSRTQPPPRIDSSAANKPFTQTTLSPMSAMSNYSDAKSYSSLSSGNGRAPFSMNRSATSPVPQSMASSPQYSSNLDSPFPRFPTARSATTTSAKSLPRDRLQSPYKHEYVEPSPLFAPVSPRTDGGSSVLKRMNTIAPGPFDSRPSTSDGRGTRAPSDAGFGHKRSGTQGSIRSNGMGFNQRTSLASTTSRNSTFSNGNAGLPLNPKAGKTGLGALPPPPLPPPKEDMPTQSEGIDAFLQRLQKETMSSSPQERSRTPPVRQERRDVTASPPRTLGSKSPSRLPTDMDPTSSAPRSASLSPARSATRAGSKSSVRSNEPPLPLAYRPSYGNPIHTPSDSGYSDDSVSSGFRSAASSRSSPPGSEASGHSRHPSKVGREFFDEPVPRVASPETFIAYQPPQQTETRKKPSGFNKARAPSPSRQPPPMAFPNPPESPMDPAIQFGLSNQIRPRELQVPNMDPALNLLRSPVKRTPEPESRRPVNRRPTTANRGRCRGCSETITGKSVKDSSGRLTGRYHKECFVCRTCQDPFPSAEFYVFDNSPYCEQHYHELNGSMCKRCNRGIEGQYLETDRRQKFHPRCFTCSTCRIVLRDDYYEVGGRVFCDRHAFHAAQQNTFLGPGGQKPRNLQKRTTRLMMMT
ncbi:hypothetical protein K505DRAFT_125591 [Melanomma pulvis-pyrius CBS 109.77]|uniref:LIM zinc-binding domain-containing protein n=1 Tax=Melanomma pulvis-pyrius CBS 109.77 TaxID=1314802 RepID=A0A6A6WUE2_9PLEO|nr:hypothetical protein K505DRAFT_125591 [Melanomma pulvis-pyrius CBS 109.77]